MAEIILAYDRLDDVKMLFSEYTQMLLSLDPEFRLYLEIQHYDEEEKNPSGKYALPDGRLYLALVDGFPAGCIALHRLDSISGELKRLYVRPAFRGRHIAWQLAERIIGDARAIGYRNLYLDTLPELSSAVSLYRRLGFVETDPYNDGPEDRTIFMKLSLELT